MGGSHKMPDMDTNEGRKKSGFEAILLTDEDDALWEAGLAESNQQSWLQWLPWLRCAGKHLGKLDIIGIETSGRLIGGLAGLVEESNGKPTFRSFFLTAFHGLWIRDKGLRPSHVESLTRTVAETLVPFLNERYSQWSFSPSPELIDIRPFTHLGCGIEVFYTYRIQLADADTMMAGFEKDVRRVIRRSTEAGLKFEEAELNEENLATHAALLLVVAEREGWGGAVPSPAVFTDLARVCVEGGRAALFLVRNTEGTPVCSLLLTWDEHRSFAFLGASKLESGQTSAMRFMQWSAFNWAHEKGMREMDLLGGNLPGIRQFKRAWNPVTVPYFTISGGNSGVETRKSHLRKAAKHLVQAIVGDK